MKCKHADLKCVVTEQGEAVWPVTGCDASVASAPGGPHWSANPTGNPAKLLPLSMLLSARTGLGQVAGQVILGAHQCCHHRGCMEEWQMRPGRPQVTSTKLLLLETYDSVT